MKTSIVHKMLFHHFPFASYSATNPVHICAAGRGPVFTIPNAHSAEITTHVQNIYGPIGTWKERGKKKAAGKSW